MTLACWSENRKRETYKARSSKQNVQNRTTSVLGFGQLQLSPPCTAVLHSNSQSDCTCSSSAIGLGRELVHFSLGLLTLLLQVVQVARPLLSHLLVIERTQLARLVGCCLAGFQAARIQGVAIRIVRGVALLT